jgi:hypothetical protein
MVNAYASVLETPTHVSTNLRHHQGVQGKVYKKFASIYILFLYIFKICALLGYYTASCGKQLPHDAV